MTLEEQITDCLLRLRRARTEHARMLARGAGKNRITEVADAVKLLDDRLDTLLSRVPRTPIEQAVPA
ncbi:hypothetical protein LZP97_26875 (plasmid) [Rhodococcus sp. DMF-1]|uniref:hypothetical protein n=1 Tax=Rhodococcus TaxID=1827 RepID=UPI00065FB0E5|nr:MULTISPECIES: hypothetical protein [Rhodococcus]UIR36964.1 hypothetical protein LZP97_25860 [Rhodococcus sp. DMF-1]UIR36998.1 hypothetical protein LZP97_00020 [Rhodococcus sp. DMF-1]UIR39810.1 hypothetical protein LZP97_26875 [Rhodococcus sp. DMF-1]